MDAMAIGACPIWTINRSEMYIADSSASISDREGGSRRWGRNAGASHAASGRRAAKHLGCKRWSDRVPAV